MQSDRSDAMGIVCSRSVQIQSEQQKKQSQRLWQAWCLAGRRCKHGAEAELANKNVKNGDL